jgi:hypothetical protein
MFISDGANIGCLALQMALLPLQHSVVPYGAHRHLLIQPQSWLFSVLYVCVLLLQGYRSTAVAWTVWESGTEKVLLPHV